MKEEEEEKEEVKRTITEINLSGEYKLRFDPKEVRISIDGDRIDVGRCSRSLEEESLNPDDYEIPPPGYQFLGRPPLKKKKGSREKREKLTD